MDERDLVTYPTLKHPWFKVFVAGAACLTGAGGVYAYNSSNFVPVAKPGTSFAGKDLSGLTKAEVDTALKDWWALTQTKQIAFEEHPDLNTIDPVTVADLGVEFDLEASAERIPFDTYSDVVLRKVGKGETTSSEAKPVLRITDKSKEFLKNEVESSRKPGGRASVTLDGDMIKRTYETAKLALKESDCEPAVTTAVLSGEAIKLPLVPGKKQIEDADLDKIVTPIGKYATYFSSGPSRTTNIRVASSMINGLVLKPGDSFSFNGYLGRRTEAKGFKRAGIYLNGRHDFDTGGGVCQVSTTLYNAVLQSGLKIRSRSPHSMPVAYVPLGQDAAVSYPNLDFSFENTRSEPIAIASKYRDGRIEFVILGASKNEGEVKIVNKLIKSGSTRTVVERNPSLPAGSRKIIERGSAPRTVASWRLVTVNGVTKKESLGYSYYRGGAQVIQVGTKARPKAKPKPEDPESDTTTASNANE